MTRIEKIKNFLNEHKLDAFYIAHLPNIRYLSGFSGSSAYIIISPKKDYFLTDFRYKKQSAEQVKGFEISVNYNVTDELKNIFANEKFKKVGFESTYMSVNGLETLKTLFPDVKFIPQKEQLEKFTMQKTPDEIARLKKACEITDETFSRMLKVIKPGMTELEVSAEITYTQKKLGASKDAFDPIVASGWRGALPHGIASSKKIEKGDMVTLDFGCVYEGFCSDMTRTIAVGEPSDEMKKIYEIVLQSQLKASSSAKSGMSSKELDSVARNYIAEKGYGSSFGHGLGHGLGIEVHELPGLSQRSDVKLVENSIVTIEPGIYVEGLGGVRIEDDVLLTNSHCEALNKSKKELIII